MYKINIANNKLNKSLNSLNTLISIQEYNLFRKSHYLNILKMIYECVRELY